MHVAVVLLLMVVSISALFVRISAFSLELTGIPWEQAKFQALSAFTNAGFTTRESEAIVQHPVRRRIISTVIILGNAGIVTVIGTFAGTMLESDVSDSLESIGIIAGGLIVLSLLSRWTWLMEAMRRQVKAFLAKRYNFQPPKAEELLRLGEGYDLTRIELSDASPCVNKALKELDLPSWMVQVLAIERAGDFKPVPRGNDRLLAGDALIVYGAEGAIQKVFKPRKSTKLTMMGATVLDDSAQ
jgi:hypothetical protein